MVGQAQAEKHEENYDPPHRQPIDKSQLFVVSTSAKGKMRHTVANAGWGIPLDKWTTTCGWPFVRYQQESASNARIWSQRATKSKEGGEWRKQWTSENMRPLKTRLRETRLLQGKV